MIVGSFVVDLMARSETLPIPGQTVKGSFFKMGPGGKGSNQAVAAFRSGGDVSFLTKIGRDLFSSVALDFYHSEKMDTSLVFKDATQNTGIALIMVDEKSQNSISVVPGACSSITFQEITKASGVLKRAKVFLTQLETNLDIIPYAVGKVRENQGTTILNPAPAQPLSDAFLALFDIITPNETEASILSGVKVVNRESAEKAADVLIGKGVKTVLITMGAQGVFLKERGSRSQFFPALPVKVIDTTGAGDAFNGGLAVALSEEKSLQDSILFATAVAALSVTKIGTAPSMPLRTEVDQFFSSVDKDAYFASIE